MCLSRRRSESRREHASGGEKEGCGIGIKGFFGKLSCQQEEERRPVVPTILIVNPQA